MSVPNHFALSILPLLFNLKPTKTKVWERLWIATQKIVLDHETTLLRSQELVFGISPGLSYGYCLPTD